MRFTDFEICDVIIIGIATYWKLHLCLFLLNPKYYQMKFGQMLVLCMTNISNMFLAEGWRLETRSSSFFDFIKLTIKRDQVIYNSDH